MQHGDDTGLDVPRRLALLTRAAELLSSSRDFDETMAHSVGAFLPTLGDFGFFDLVVGQEVRRTARAHDDPRVEAILRPTRWIRQERTDMNLCALSTGRPALHPGIDDAWYRAIAVNEGHLGVLRELAFESMLTVPMRYQGELLGALTLFFGRSGRQHTEEHLAFAAVLAAHAAPVVANARLLVLQADAAAALRSSEERLRVGMDAGRLGVWDWDIAGDRVSWSERVYDLHGVRPGAFPGGLQDFSALVHPDDRGPVRAEIGAALRGDRPYQVEFRVPLADGTTRWLATRADVVRDEDGTPVRMVGATYDVTERVELLEKERQARAEAEEARRAMERVARAGALFSRSLALDDTLAAIGDVIVPDLADGCRVDLLEAGALEPVLVRPADPELAAPAALAREVGVRASLVVPLLARGRSIGVLTLVLDRSSTRSFTPATRALVEEIGGRAALAVDNARLFAQAERARQEAESASRAKDDFLAMLGHELRNPLAPIATALAVLDARGLPGGERERAIMGRQVAHLTRLVDDLLDVARITRGKVRLDREPLDLRRVVARAVEAAGDRLSARPVSIDVDLGADAAGVDGDAVRLGQVIDNLLANAARFSPAGSRVELRLACSANEVELVLRDEGVGIAPELLPRIFDPFVQGPQSIARDEGGLGLGLAISAHIVEQHGGRLVADSAGVGRGSTFRLLLPRSAGEVRPVPDRAAPGPHRAARVLVVDDNADAAELLVELLAASGFEVRAAQDGPAALSLSSEFAPHVAILDIGLPGMDGYELARRLRSGVTPPRLVALTGYGRGADRERAIAAGFDRHLVKPADPDLLLDVVAGLAPVRVRPSRGA